MNSFKNSCVIQMEKIALKIDGKAAQKPAVIPIDETSYRLRTETSRRDLRLAKEFEPQLTSRLHAIHKDLKYVYTTFDGLKSSYVVDNTKMIELDEICLNHKQLLGATSS